MAWITFNFWRGIFHMYVNNTSVWIQEKKFSFFLLSIWAQQTNVVSQQFVHRVRLQKIIYNIVAVHMEKEQQWYRGNKANDLVFAKSYDIATAMPLLDLEPSLLEGQIKQTFTEAFIKSDSYSFNTEKRFHFMFLSYISSSFLLSPPPTYVA